jgi:hypothetical protein
LGSIELVAWPLRKSSRGEGTRLFAAALAHPDGLAPDGAMMIEGMVVVTVIQAARRLPRHIEPRKGAGLLSHQSVARTAGATPVRSGDPGYARHLDHDGAGCE